MVRMFSHINLRSLDTLMFMTITIIASSTVCDPVLHLVDTKGSLI